MRVLKARFKDKDAFLEAYSEEIPGGAIFCSTTTPLEPEDRVVVEINFPELPNKMLVRGTVVSWRNALPRLRVRAGAVVAFDDTEEETRVFLLGVAAGQHQDAIKRRHARVPVELEVKWRPTDSADLQTGRLNDISIGGAQLLTEETLAPEDDIVVELVAPGGATSISIAGKVSNQTPAGYGISSFIAMAADRGACAKSYDA